LYKIRLYVSPLVHQDQVPNHSAGRSEKPTQQRLHVERMLARAERRSRQAAKLVEKWKTRLADLDREGIAAKQAKLFADDLPGQGSEAVVALSACTEGLVALDKTAMSGPSA
jgi:hypothetical protein